MNQPGPSAPTFASKDERDLQEAVALHQRGQLSEAERIYRKVRKRAPGNFDATHLLGVALFQRHQFVEAEQLIAKALEIRPRDPSALNNYGNALRRLGRREDALVSFNKAISFKHDHAEAFYNRGVVLQELERFGEALASYDRAIFFNPRYVQAHNNRASTLRRLERLDEALASYDRAIALKPDYVEALSNRGVVLQELKRLDEALASYDRAIALQPDHVEALCNRGSTLQQLGRHEEAMAGFDKAIALKPNYVEALSNRANIFVKLNRHDEALESYKAAIALKPDHAEARFSRSMLFLLKGNYAEGWEDYEWRLSGGTKDLAIRKFEQPRWQGEDLAGKTILLHAEQGYGDTIQFCRYAELVAARGARVILEVQAPLREVMRTLSGVAEIVSAGEALPDFDLHCPLPSLPRAFGTRLSSLPAPRSYLRAATHIVERWSAQLGPRSRPRIGVCWGGNSQFKGDATRSIGLSPMLPLLTNEDVQFFSLQKDLRAGDAEILRDHPQVTHLGTEIGTFADTAAIMALMDVMISSDTSVVHLAGALGRPTWILLQLVPDWRWLLDRDDSPWYPTARLFRQAQTRKWDEVIVQVQGAIRSEPFRQRTE